MKGESTRMTKRFNVYSRMMLATNNLIKSKNQVCFDNFYRKSAVWQVSNSGMSKLDANKSS